MPRKKTLRIPTPDPRPEQPAAAAPAPAPTWDRVAHYHELKKRYPPVPVNHVVTPISEFRATAERFQDTMHQHVTAYVGGDRLRMLQLFDEAEAICTRVSGLSLAARQVGYQLTNFDPVEVERRCRALADVCSEALTKSAYKYEEAHPEAERLMTANEGAKGLYSPWREELREEVAAGHRTAEEAKRLLRGDAYSLLAEVYDSYYTALNAVLELEIAVRPELWETWPYRPKGEVQTTSTTAGKPDGVEGGRWLWWQGRRHDIPTGVIYRLIEFMWDKDTAHYDDLTGPVFEESVLPESVRARASEAGKCLKKIGVPWKLKPDAVSRILTKQASD